MADTRHHEMDGFSLGTPALVCRWRLAAGMLLLGNRHIRALARRIVNGRPITPELVAWAKQLGHANAATLLKETLDQEYGADRALSKLAETRLNADAAA